ncbi:MAG TPA: 4Fe-4S dicluster domain-containing protein [Anaerolineales bacterium]
MTDIQHKTFLFDATRCIDCRACMVACSVENKIPMNKTRIWVAGVGLKGEYPALERASMAYHCMHCNEPDCLSACPVGAYSKRSDGPVIYDPKKCIGCRYCMNACPFGVPHFDYDKGLIDGAFIDKCSMCTQRIDVGLEPACVATCPTGALMFGERDELLKYAHDRLTAQPARYLNHVYGESENGGTSYLILSHVPFKELGLPELPSSPVKDISEAVMRLTLPSALGVGAVLTGLAVGVHMVNQKKEAGAKKADRSESSAQETK